MPVYSTRATDGSKVVVRRHSFTSPMRKHGGDVAARPMPGVSKAWTQPSAPIPITIRRGDKVVARIYRHRGKNVTITQ